MPGPSDAQKAVEEFQRLIAAQDARASASVVRAYAPVYRQLQKDTQELVRIAKERGLKPWQVGRMDRMKDLNRQFLAGTAKFANAAGDTITNSQRAAVGLARRGARRTVEAGLPPGVSMENLANVGLGWNRLPEEAFANFVGIAADGKPLGNLLAPLGPEAAQGVTDAIGTGIATGKGPRQTAQLVRVAAGIPLSKALLITRTETNRAFRESTRLQYANNSQVVKGYRRLAAQSDRTCIACIALDGTLYALDEPLNEHPNGRCALVPDTITYEDLGLDVEMPPQPENARDWLARQPDVTQRKILGDVRFEAIQRGELQLNQLATVRPNAVWGDAAVVRPIKDLGLGKGGPGGVAIPKAPLGTPPPSVPVGDLIDPKTGATVRGTRQAPPEPILPKDWDVRTFGDPDDFLDIAPIDADPSMIKYRGATGREAIQAQVAEQEAWARAAGGAIEVDYNGLSIRAAQEVNKAVEVTVVRNRWRPLDIISTSTDRDNFPFKRAYAYQSYKGVHIQTGSSTWGGPAYRGGSVRGWDAANIKDNAHVKLQKQQWQNRLVEYDVDLQKKKQEMVDTIKAGLGPKYPGLEDILRERVRDAEGMVKKAKTEIQKKTAERFHPTHDTEFLKQIITHEIGHYGHGRWGWNYRSEILRGKKGKDHARNVSEYALKNHQEHFAEAFAEYHWMDKSRLGGDVIKLIEDVIDANTKLANQEGYSIGKLYDALKEKGAAVSVKGTY